MGHSMFDNVFADPAAYREFMRTGTWPDGTQLLLEVRGASEKGSINQHGNYQDGAVMGLEVHVKDVARFEGGWSRTPRLPNAGLENDGRFDRGRGFLLKSSQLRQREMVR